MQKSKELLQFINDCPSAYHTASEVLSQLRNAGVVVLEETQDWTPHFEKIKDTGGNFAILRGGTVMAFRLPPRLSQRSEDNASEKLPHTPLPHIRLWAAHTDSPCLKIKNKGIKFLENVGLLLGIESYGGINKNSFLDRNLSIAGRVVVEKDNDQMETRLIDFAQPMAIIPSLATHLQEKNHQVNEESELRPILFIDPAWYQSTDPKFVEPNAIFEGIVAQKLGVAQEKILSYDLFVYPCDKANFLGMKNNVIGARSLDNLSMTHAGVSGFLHAIKKSSHSPKNQIDCLALFNHEEVGSLSDEGALSFLLERTLRRIGNTFFKKDGYMERIFANSFILSADVSHAWHPNYLQAHSEFHRPKMGGSIILKRHARLCYATQAHGEALIVRLLRRHNIPFQHHSNRNDKASGSTIGSMLTSRIGAHGVDMGGGIWSMHSTKELMNAQDHEQICTIAQIFFEDESWMNLEK